MSGGFPIAYYAAGLARERGYSLVGYQHDHQRRHGGLVDHDGSGLSDIEEQMTVTTGTSVSPLRGPYVAGQNGAVEPVLPAQDGSFVGTVWDQLDDPSMVAFDASGNVRWVAPNDQPAIATADGGVIGQSGTTYDQNANATGQVGNLPTFSWFGYAYQDGPVTQVLLGVLYFAAGW